jgi:hypothetical protein
VEFITPVETLILSPTLMQSITVILAAVFRTAGEVKV